MLNPLFSLIIPVYNVDKYIEQLLISIVKQDFTSYEVVIINDGSTDASGNICDKFCEKHKNISVFHQENAGVSIARNKGIELAKGNYIWFVDGDDLIEKNALVSLDNLLKKYNYDLDVLGFSFNSLTNNKLIPFEKKEFLVPVDGDTFLKHYERLALWTFLYKRTLIVNNNLKFVKGVSVFEDNLFNYEVFNNANKIIQTNYHLYNYRNDRDESAMNSIDFDVILRSILLISQRLNTIKLNVLSKKTLNKLKFYFWESFLIYFDKSKKTFDENFIKKTSIQLYHNSLDLKPSITFPIYINYDIMVYSICKTKFLLIREFYIVKLLKKILIKSSLILKR